MPDYTNMEGQDFLSHLSGDEDMSPYDTFRPTFLSHLSGDEEALALIFVR